MIKIGAAWSRFTEKGMLVSVAFDKAAKGVMLDLGETNLLLFENQDKKSEQSPDFDVCLAEKKDN
jgi:uncharacterized protein (DUF736 family)